MNRLDRITAILIQLQSKRVVKAQDIADRFGISLRTVYRDVGSLEEAGVPIIGEAGVGYSIMDGYRLPPVMFTREEATAFLTAEKLVDKLTDRATAQQFTDALYKIKSVLRSNEKGMLENVENAIHVFKYGNANPPGGHSNYIYRILNSINENKVLRISYQAMNASEPSERCIEPVGIYFISNTWHVIAWCNLRKDYRDFRLDRIHSIQETNDTFTKKNLSLKDYMSDFLYKNQLLKAVVSFDKGIAKYIQEQRLYFGFTSEEDKGSKIEMTFYTGSLHYFASWLVSFGRGVTILEPTDLVDEVKKFIKTLNEHYN